MDQRPIVLVVDDQPDNILILVDLLSKLYRVESVGDGSELFERLAAGPNPDLILLDVVMPRMDGFETCRRLKEEAATSDIPIIFLTSLDGTGDEERGIALGADDFVRKPLIPGVVLARVGNLLGRRETERRRREVAVLEARVAEHQRNAAALQSAIDRLTVMNTELERFTMVAAHDLREPIRSVSMYAQMLQRRSVAKLDENERQYLDYLVEGATRIYDMIGSLLTYANVSLNAGQLHPVSAAFACKAALENLSALAEESGAELVVGPLPEVEADDVLLLQVFQNLISNALKFRHPLRRARIEVSARPIGTEWHFAVTDNGIGFNAEGEDVFELFRQLSPSDRRIGTGSGLAICKRIVQRLGGRIWAESTPDQGSVFHFALPVPD
ncbi:putative two-component sensor histidine kinase, hybrid system (CheY-like superfamily 2-199;ATPase-like, ATP-binding domain 238-382) [Magnetospirillum sp. XM-1]|uniref:sensor histidine kinase n=1 Tax=Magnetospirillum sp. XM-1 TaxID=1663591 RepID=UPI00073DE604|nr:ATP-binding protein [Magnetospirillum sp. XM-1]CUW38657.1 putative two-component sensor histidine kinase, hybrid system (CheY-like superfamily 2-199;ATPase-like, ATP-binding domain 238-382) [Magnetospirillum sp. XM-1]